MLSERVKRLREQSVNTPPYISTERAELLTEFYRSGAAEGISTPMARALAFKFLMENKTIYINENELIVGERGPDPRGTPTYPELCCHTIEDLEISNARERSQFIVSDSAKETYRDEIISFWRGKT
ncbi:MAG: pyruvate formate lyase family protein, partial [Candidatus Thorarchaeota archaeon]